MPCAFLSDVRQCRVRSADDELLASVEKPQVVEYDRIAGLSRIGPDKVPARGDQIAEQHVRVTAIIEKGGRFLDQLYFRAWR